MSRGRRPKLKENVTSWQQLYNKNVGLYLKIISVELSTVKKEYAESASELLIKIKEEKKALNEGIKSKRENVLKPINVEEFPYKIPENWVWCRLGEIAELKSGNQYSYPKSENGIMYVKVGDMNLVGNEFEITNSSSYFEREFVNERDLILPGGIIFPKRGGAIATNKRRAVLNEPILVDSNTMAVIPSTKISFNYFFLWFNEIDLSKLGNDGVIPQVNNKDLNPILMPLPPFTEQLNILNFLNDFENENLKSDGYYFNQEVEEKVVRLHISQLKGSEISYELTHQLSLVKKLRQQLLQDAVQGKLVEQDLNDEPASELLEKIKAEKEQLIKAGKTKKEKELSAFKEDEIPFKIPEDWVWCRLGEICTKIFSRLQRRPDIRLLSQSLYFLLQSVLRYPVGLQLVQMMNKLIVLKGR